MNNQFTPQQLEEINLDRAATMAKTLISCGGIPVLVCGVIPGPEGKGKLVTFTFYHVPVGYGT